MNRMQHVTALAGLLAISSMNEHDRFQRSYGGYSSGPSLKGQTLTNKRKAKKAERQRKKKNR